MIAFVTVPVIVTACAKTSAGAKQIQAASFTRQIIACVAGALGSAPTRSAYNGLFHRPEGPSHNSTVAKIVANYLLGNYEYEMLTASRVLAAVPSDNLAYQPDSRSKSGTGLVRHIAFEDEWLRNSIADGQFNPPPDDSDACGIVNAADAVAR